MYWVSKGLCLDVFLPTFKLFSRVIFILISPTDCPCLYRTVVHRLCGPHDPIMWTLWSTDHVIHVSLNVNYLVHMTL